MRTNTQRFNVFNQSSSKDLRLVVMIGFLTPVYLSSHNDIPNLPAGTITDTLTKTSSISQSLQPSAGRATIGSMSFSLLDIDGAVTQVLRNANALKEGSKGVKVQLYRGGIGMPFEEFRLEQTQQIDKTISYKNHVYSIACADIQRTLRKDIFDISKTQLSTNLDESSDVINVIKTTGFHFCDHAASFSDMPNGQYLYLKIKKGDSFEIARATGKTATSFTGVSRGLFGTKNIAHIIPENAGDDNGVIIEEYIYIELPGPALAYALLTGEIIGGGVLPASWHLGLLPADVNVDAFTGVGEDLFDQTDFTKGFIVRFEGLTKVDGKAFIEKEICLLLGAFMPVLADGRISLKRMSGVLSTADAIGELNEDNIISHGKIKYDNSKIYNELSISWVYMQFPGQKAQFYRKNKLLDVNSINKHGKGSSYALSFKGLHSSRHTMSTVKYSFNALRDRYAGPPLLLDVKLMPSMNDLEVGDIFRVRLPNQRDFLGFDTLDRSFEIQKISINQTTGDITASLFGSSEQASEVVDDDVSASAELPDSFYSIGQNISSLLSITAGALQENGSLTGGIGQRTVFYHLGDFTIPANTTLNIIGNVELRILGHLQIDGEINTTSNAFSNYLGTTVSGGGFLVSTAGGKPEITPVDGGIVVGKNSVLPALNIINNAGVLSGLPVQMSGTKGSTGASTNYDDNEQRGGYGGAGGGSIVVISRGVGFGVSGQVDLSGQDGETGFTVSGYNSGTGGGGAPGCCVFLIDGVDASYPILQGNIIAKFGFCVEKSSGVNSQFKGKSIEEIDLGVAACRVLYVPKTRSPYSIPEELETVLPPVDELIYSPLTRNINQGLLSWKKPELGITVQTKIKIFDDNGDHLWVKYADDLTGTNLSNSAAGKTAIGFALNQISAVKSNDPADYQWQVIDQVIGYQVAGLQGEPRFLWVKYSTNLQGTSPSDTHAGNSYIGVSLNNRAPEKSTSPGDYLWLSAFGTTSLDLNENPILLSTINTLEDELYLAGLAAGKYRASVATIYDDDISIFKNVLIEIPEDTFDALTPQKGTDYEDGKNGTHTSYIFKCSVEKPTKPTGGSYDGSDESTPSGYAASPIYVTDKVTWVSRAVYVHDGSAWAHNGWSEPVEYIIRGPVGPVSTTPGPTGPRGPGKYSITTTQTSWSDGTNTIINAAALAETGGNTLADEMTVSNSALEWTQTRYWDGTSWQLTALLIDGNLVVNALAIINKLAANSIKSGVVDVDDLLAISATVTNSLTIGNEENSRFITELNGNPDAMPIAIYDTDSNTPAAERLLFGIDNNTGKAFFNGGFAPGTISDINSLTPELRDLLVTKNAGATGGIESIAAYALDTSTEVISKTLTIASANSSNATISVNFSDSDSFLTSDPLVEKLAPTYTVVISRSKNGGAFVPIKTLSVHGNITMVERPNVNSYYHTLDLVGDLSFIDTTHGSVSGQALAYSVAINKTSSAGWSNAPIASALSIAQSAQGGGSSAYVLPKASSTTLGGVKLTVTDGVLNITTD